MDDSPVASRIDTRARAVVALHEHGFTEQSNGEFQGELVEGDQRFAVRLILPKKFPDELPMVFVSNHESIARRAHIENSGKLCLFPTTGILVDTDLPEQIVIDSLARAHSILFDNEDDYRTEFLAYWRQGYEPELLFVASDHERAHALAAVATSEGFLLIGDGYDALSQWLNRVGWQADEHHSAFLVPLQELPDAPPFGTITNHRDAQGILQRHATDEDRTAFNSWLKTSGLPAYLVLSAPSVNGSGRIIFGYKLQKAEGKAADTLHKGFRPGRLPPALEVARSRRQPAIRIEPNRADADYLISRVGGDVTLQDSTAIIIGCGSLGSQIAVYMAASGVGTITFIDNDVLSADNVHRHALGMSYAGQNKASALRDYLLARFPHLSLHAVSEEIEDVLSRRTELLHGIDLAIIATGDETLERRLNACFDPGLRRIHGWLEPLGVGGHALLTGPSGCYNCLFDRDDDGLHNLASLVERGQNFLRTIVGCTATFTPFGFVDAAQGAVEVTRLALEVLGNKDAEARLVSWTGAADQFISAGYALSKRGERTLSSSRIIDHDYRRADCEICRGR